MSGKIEPEKVANARQMSLLKKHAKGGRLSENELAEISEYLPVKNKAPSSPDTNSVSSADLAAWLGVVPSRIRQLVGDGIVERGSDNRYPLKKNVLKFIAWQRQKLLEKAGFGDASAELKAEQMRLTKARADNAELDLALKKGTLHEAEAVAFVVNGMLVPFRQRVLSIAVKTAPIVADLSEALECQGIIEEACHEALSELSEYDPQSVVARQVAAVLNKPKESDDGD